MINKKTKIKLANKNLNYYRNLYGEFLKKDDIIEINISDLPPNSRKKIDVKCDCCGLEKSIPYCDYMKNPKQNGEYYCKNCRGEAIKQGCIKMHGVENVFQLKETKDKTKSTCLKKYGHEHHLQNQDILEKQKKTNLERYDKEYQMQREENKIKSKITCLEKYESEISSQSEMVKNKVKENNLKKYGLEYPNQLEEVKQKISNSKNKKIIENFKELGIISINKNIYTFNCEKGHNYETSSTLLYNRQKINTILCTICNPINNYSTSGLETQLKEFIKENYSDEILFSDRTLINPFEIDIFLPKIKLAFEFNGVYWHNELNKSNNYHYDKTIKCLEKGVKLIHIYEDDWQYKQQIIKSIILNHLDKSTKIYARNCSILEIKNDIAREFLEKNHIQGYVASSIKLGLFYNDELVSLMTFGNQRKATGQKSKEGNFELIRFCNKLNTTIIGGASKLFKYFIDNYEYNEIISYADRSFSIGNLYKQLGFTYIGETKPNYYYVIDGMRFHRYNFRKDILVKEGYDANKTEHQIMIDRKIYRIYDSGSLKFIKN